MDILISDATEADLPGILDIYNDAILTTTAVYDYKPHTMEMRMKWFRDKQRDNIPVLVAKDMDVVAGFVSYGPFRAWAAYRYSIEHSVYVHKAYRGRGIARQLLTSLLSIVSEKEVHTIIAGIDSTNDVSYNLHRKLGFSEVALFRQVGYKFGKWLDLRFMQLILDGKFQPNENQV